MFNLKRNNLDKSLSPYLQQHKDNPIWWHEWSGEIIKVAARENKPLFVSVGYATCHWCHVMASEAFSDRETADYLNENFICIKVDRELRPDIDQFLMSYIIAQSGSGGWPLNVFLTPDIQPFLALTYAPAESNGSMGSFLTIAQKVNDYYIKNPGNIKPFIPGDETPPVAEEYYLIISLVRFADPLYGGFGQAQKFPPHTTLLFLLYSLSINDKIEVRKVCSNTLDAMCLRGLNDHLQGGIFRYCVDREWTIPHFEKMLYDQAMALWCYSLAYKTIGKSEYKTMAENILRCLDESFEDNGLYISGHDADTEHSEGATYLWDYDELKKELSEVEFSRLSEVYNIEKPGNFENRIHLIKKFETSIADVESKLLLKRKQKVQPDKDEKILCGINALTAIAMIHAAWFFEKPGLEEKASGIIKRLIELFWDGKTLGHSMYKGKIQNQNFLFDAAAVLAAITYLYENDKSWESMMDSMKTYTESFRQDEAWLESRPDDFHPVNASWFDHPIPSSISLAEMGLTRAAVLKGNEIQKKPYRESFRADFYNIAAMLSNGLFHVITSKNKISWGMLKPNSIQLRGETESDCFNGTCSVLKIH